MARTWFSHSWSLQQGQRSNQDHTKMLHTYNPWAMSLPSVNSLHFPVSKILPGQDLKGQGYYSKVKDQIKVTLQHFKPTIPNNVPTKYLLPTPYGFWYIARTRFNRSKSLGQHQSQIKVTPRHSIPTTPNQCPHKVSTSYTLQFPRCSPDKSYRSRSLQQG